jgi:tripartite-type tricarboxylate transporter receptor subunit TctC
MEPMNSFIKPFAIVGMFVIAGSLYAQTFPSKPIRLLAAEPGGGADIVGRLVAPGLSSNMGQQIVIDNRPAGVIPGQIVAKAPPDGYTLLVSSGILWLMAFMRDSMPFDPVKDFAPITVTNRAPNILVVHPTLPANSVKDLIALAKAKQGQLNYASGATGSSSQIAAELFKSMTGTSMVRIPYKGNGPAMTALLAGDVNLMFPSAAAVAPHMKSGKVRVLAVTSLEPSALFPGLPTVAASGLPGYESATVTGIWAPAHTPAAVINKLNAEIVRVLNTAQVKERFMSAGSEIVGNTPSQFAAFIKHDMATTGKVIKDAGIREE